MLKGFHCSAHRHGYRQPLAQVDEFDVERPSVEVERAKHCFRRVLREELEAFRKNGDRGHLFFYKLESSL